MDLLAERLKTSEYDVSLKSARIGIFQLANNSVMFTPAIFVEFGSGIIVPSFVGGNEEEEPPLISHSHLSHSLSMSIGRDSPRLLSAVFTKMPLKLTSMPAPLT